MENNKRKAAQRKREKEKNKENCNISAADNSESDTPSKSRKREKTGAMTSGSELSDVVLASDDGHFAVPTPNRQYILGLQQRE